MSRYEAIKEIDELIEHMIGPYGEEPECSTLRSIKNKLLKSEPEPEFEHLCCEPECGALACKYCGYCRTEHSGDPVTDCPKKPIHRTTAKCTIIDRLSAEKRELFEKYTTLIASCHELALEDMEIKAEIKAKDEALKLAVDTFKACLSEEDDPKFKNFNVDDIVMAGQICEQALKGD